MIYPTPHGDKLRALLENSKLPDDDRAAVKEAVVRHEAWIKELGEIEGEGVELVEPMVRALSHCKNSIDLDLVFDSSNDFLYRQKGQLKLDNTIVEEFMPWLVGRVLEKRLPKDMVTLGPTNCFSHLRFDSALSDTRPGGGMAIRSKDQDFAMARPLFIRASHQPDFSESVEAQTHLGYVAAEIKTNLDKTMFQEAAATAYDLKLSLPNSRYFLLCEWLDMTPITTSVTAIEEVIILRKAKRLASNVRKDFSTADGRASARDDFSAYLVAHPFSPEAFERFLRHVEALIGDGDEDEELVLGRGWF